MKFSLFIAFIALFQAISAQQYPGTFVSTTVQTAYNSKCTTSSASTSVASVPTSVTSSINLPPRKISSTNTFTPTQNVFVTSTPGPTVTFQTLTVFTQPAQQRRDLSAAQETAQPSLKRRDENPIAAQEDMRQKQQQLAGLSKRNLRFERALYPANVQCAVSAIAGTTSFFTATAASRTVTRTATFTATNTLAYNRVYTDAPQNPGFETQNAYWIPDGGNFQGYSNNAHSGSLALLMGRVGSEGTVSSPSISGNNGALYTLSFWLAETSPRTTSIFRILWNGVEVFNTNTAEPNYWNSQSSGYLPYKQYTINLVGQDSNVLTFSARQDPAYFYLDDVRLLSVIS